RAHLAVDDLAHVGLAHRRLGRVVHGEPHQDARRHGEEDAEAEPGAAAPTTGRRGRRTVAAVGFDTARHHGRRRAVPHRLNVLPLPGKTTSRSGPPPEPVPRQRGTIPRRMRTRLGAVLAAFVGGTFTAVVAASGRAHVAYRAFAAGLLAATAILPIGRLERPISPRTAVAVVVIPLGVIAIAVVLAAPHLPNALEAGSAATPGRQVFLTSVQSLVALLFA